MTDASLFAHTMSQHVRPLGCLDARGPNGLRHIDHSRGNVRAARVRALFMPRRGTILPRKIGHRAVPWGARDTRVRQREASARRAKNCVEPVRGNAAGRRLARRALCVAKLDGRLNDARNRPVAQVLHRLPRARPQHVSGLGEHAGLRHAAPDGTRRETPWRGLAGCLGRCLERAADRRRVRVGRARCA